MAAPASNETLPSLWPRALALMLILGALVVVVSSDAVHGQFTLFLEWTGRFIASHPVLGVLAFVVLAALSAMLAFFSSALLLPAAVEAWGEAASVLLLWVGWTLGGVLAYGLARHWGRPVIRWLIRGRTLARYEERLNRRSRFSAVLLFQLVVPSEIPGYVLGLAGYGLRRYLPALMLAELPYAIATVYLGEGVVERDSRLLLAVGAFLLVIGALVFLALRRRLRAGD